MIGYIIPTRDRPNELERTLAMIDSLGPHEAEVIVVDNASSVPAVAPRRLDTSGISVGVIRLQDNHGAAARTIGARAASGSCEWLVMLDDDSAPIDAGLVGALGDQHADVLAVQAEIWLGDQPPVGLSSEQAKHESGGLPEVFVGCGVAIRRAAYLATGGYDPSFGYYAEEYDLAAKLLLMGGRISFDDRFRVLHRKVSSGRNFGRIVARLVRNNAWVMRRYAPRAVCDTEVRRVINRYGRIALQERAMTGFAAGMLGLAGTLSRQQRRELPAPLWERFIGLDATRAALDAAYQQQRYSTASLTHRGKNDHVVAAALEELGVRIVSDAGADVLVIATLSPGPMLDAIQRTVPVAEAKGIASGRRVLAPWIVAQPRAGSVLSSHARGA